MTESARTIEDRGAPRSKACNMSVAIKGAAIQLQKTTSQANAADTEAVTRTWPRSA